MKKDLKTLIKTRSPIKGKISNLIESKNTPKSKISVVPTPTDPPSTDIAVSEKKDLISAPEHVSEKELSKNSHIKYMDALKQAIQNIVTNNKNYTNVINNKNVVNKNFNSKKNENVENIFNKTIKNISSFMDKNVVKNMSSINPINTHRRDERNYITSSFTLPFVQNDYVTNENTSRVNNQINNENTSRVNRDLVRNESISRINNIVRNKSNFNFAKSQKPALIEKTNNFYNPIQSSEPVKLKIPTITKFPDVVDTKTTSFNKESKHFTDRVNNMLSNSASMKIFTTKGNVIKSTKEILNHVKERQNNIVPMLQKGGLIDTPTLAMLGEYGPEMVTPITESASSMIPSLETPQSITSSANRTMLERTAYRMNDVKASTRDETDKNITISPSSFKPSMANKQTAPEGSGAGGEAGSSAFSSYFRARMFSLPDWRSRLA